MRDLNSEWKVSRVVAHQANRRELKNGCGLHLHPVLLSGLLDGRCGSSDLPKFLDFWLPAAMPGVLGIRCRVGIKGSRLKNGTRLSVLLLDSEVHHREDSRQDEAGMAVGLPQPFAIPCDSPPKIVLGVIA